MKSKIFSVNIDSEDFVKVVSSSCDGEFDLSRQTVATVQKALADPFNVHLAALAFVNGKVVKPSYCLQANDVLEFVYPDGHKSSLDPDEKAQLDRIESMLNQFFGKPADHGSPGRNIETLEIASYINQLRQQKFTWKKVFKACRERWPNDAHVRNADQLRATFRRYFGARRKKAD